MSARDLIDRPRATRPGEEVDVVRLAAYLREHLPDAAGELAIEQFPRGFSNLTYLVRLGGQELVLRRPPFGVAAGSAHDMGREFRIIGALHDAGMKVPRALLHCTDVGVLGAPFYLMQRVRGVILRGEAPAGVALDASIMRRLSESFIDELRAIHEVDHHGAGLADLGHPEGYVSRQIAGWSRRYAAARTGDQPELERAAAWLAGQQVAERGATLIHNDFKYDNLVLDPADLASILAVLDWEMATIGDPMMDIGTSLAYWVDANDPEELRSLGLGLTALPGNLGRAALVERYAAATGRDAENVLFYYVYGLFKLAVVAQQIHVRYVRGLTKDPRFATLDAAVRALGVTATLAIEKGRIERLAD